MAKRIWIKPSKRNGKIVKGHYRTVSGKGKSSGAEMKKLKNTKSSGLDIKEPKNAKEWWAAHNKAFNEYVEANAAYGKDDERTKALLKTHNYLRWAVPTKGIPKKQQAKYKKKVDSWWKQEYKKPVPVQKPKRVTKSQQIKDDWWNGNFKYD